MAVPPLKECKIRAAARAPSYRRGPGEHPLTGGAIMMAREAASRSDGVSADPSADAQPYRTINVVVHHEHAETPGAGPRMSRMIAAASIAMMPSGSQSSVGLPASRVVRIANRANREAPKSGDSLRIARRSIKSRIARIVI